MALPELHPVNEAVVFAHSGQIGATPAAAYARVPFRGKVLKVGVVQSGAVTGTGTVATAVNGNAIAGGSLSVTGGAVRGVCSPRFRPRPTTSTRTMSSRSRHPAPPAPRPARSSP